MDEEAHVCAGRAGHPMMAKVPGESTLHARGVQTRFCKRWCSAVVLCRRARLGALGRWWRQEEVDERYGLEHAGTHNGEPPRRSGRCEKGTHATV